MGLLDWAQTPAGMGLLSAVAGGIAGARRGTPWNNAGRGLVTGLQGYQNSKDQLTKDAETAFQNKYRQMQMDEIQSKITNNAALKNASTQSTQQAMTPGSYGPLGYRPTDPSAFDGQLAQGNAPEDQEFNQANVTAIAEGNNALAPPLPSQFDFGKYKAAMGNNLAQAGLADEALKFAPHEAKVPESYSLSPGQVRYGADNKEIVSVPSKPETTDAKIKQYEYAQSRGYKGSFEKFIAIAPTIMAGAAAPLRAAQVDNIKAENDYNLPKPKQGKSKVVFGKIKWDK